VHEVSSGVTGSSKRAVDFMTVRVAYAERDVEYGWEDMNAYLCNCIFISGDRSIRTARYLCIMQFTRPSSLNAVHSKCSCNQRPSVLAK